MKIAAHKGTLKRSLSFALSSSFLVNNEMVIRIAVAIIPKSGIRANAITPMSIAIHSGIFCSPFL